MKESLYNIEKSCVFRETFNSFDAIHKNGGTPTDVSLSNGVGSFSLSTSSIIYQKRHKGNYSVRIKGKCTNNDIARVLFDFRTKNFDGKGLGSIEADDSILISSGISYVDGSTSSSIVIGQDYDIVISDIILDYGSGLNPFTIGTNGGLAFDFVGDFYLFDIYNKALTAEEVELLYNNKLHKGITNTAGYGENIVLNWDFTSGWSMVGGAIGDNDSFTTTAAGGVKKDYSIVNGNKYRLIIEGNTTSTEFRVGDDSFSGYYTGALTGTFVFDEQVIGKNSGFYLRNADAGTTNITRFEFIELKAAELTPIMEYDFKKNKSAFNATSPEITQAIVDVDFLNQGVYFKNTNTAYIDTGINIDLTETIDFTLTAITELSNNIGSGYAASQAHVLGGSYASDWILFLSDDIFWMRSKTVGNLNNYKDNKAHKFDIVWDMNTETYEVFVDSNSIGTSDVVSGYGGVSNIALGTRGDMTTAWFNGLMKVFKIRQGKATQEQIIQETQYYKNIGYLV